MKKIASIPTHSFEPISFGDNYLYTQYEKLRSFLQVNFNQKIANFIAKPVINNSEVSWYANYYNDFKPISEFDQETQGELLSNYWDILNTINSKIKTLRSKTNNDQNEWYSLLTSVFDSENNKIHSDGQNVVILWGWKFFNAYENKLPTFIPQTIFNTPTPTEEPINTEFQPIITEDNNNEPEELIQETPLIEEDQPLLDEVEPVLEVEENKSFWARFLEFLKWFASKFWWILLILLMIILFLFFFNSCENNRNHSTTKEIDDLNNRIEYLREKTKECCGCELNENEQ
jgi:hypothetical protein